jgi:hypothetical protein
VRYRDWASLLAVLCVVETIGADLAVRLENETVVASGLRGDAVLFGASLQSERGLPTLRQFTEILSDGDRDGIVTFEPRGYAPALVLGGDRSRHGGARTGRTTGLRGGS